MFSKTIFEKSHKTSYRKNYKEVSSHIWVRDSESLRELWQNQTTGLGISAFAKKYNFSEKFLKKSQKRHISKITRI